MADWGLEIFKVFGTGATVALGAFIAFRFADMGRKNDILYKEKYRGFEGLSHILIEDISFMNGLRVRISTFHPSDNADDIFNYIEKFVYKDRNPLIKYLLLFSQDSRNIAISLDDSINDVIFRVIRDAGDLTKMAYDQDQLNSFRESSDNLCKAYTGKSKNLVNKCYRELGLVKLESVFGDWEADRDAVIAGIIDDYNKLKKKKNIG